VALVPAYDEEQSIGATVHGLLAQQTPDWLELADVVVVANNCHDRTSEIVRTYPVTLAEIPENPHRKAGAVNYGWLHYGRDADYVFTMDADTVLMPDTLTRLAQELEANSELGGVCARYWAKDGHGLLWRLQRLEYTRYDDLRELRGWGVSVLSGAAVMYRQEALLGVLHLCGRQEPWDNRSLIEDYALTLDLKAQGWRVRAARNAHVLTEPPQTLNRLWAQRLRWGRGGMDECRKRGWTPATRQDIVAYGLFLVSAMVRALWIAMLTAMFVFHVPLRYSLIGLVPVAAMLTERITSAWRLKDKCWRDLVLVLTLVVEDFYGFFLEACTVVSAWKCMRRREQQW
jgi:cellulose synthase/poly-beta-1,6-N-acetylglucosamine synthase-like glycosyltransferase